MLKRHLREAVLTFFNTMQSGVEILISVLAIKILEQGVKHVQS